MDIAERLQRLAVVAADEVRDGMVVGLGTGSTASAVIRELGARAQQGLRFRGVATSQRTEALAASFGIPLLGLDEATRIDLGIDGADEIDPHLDLIKGGGGALLIEKLVALQCDDYLVVSATEKSSPALGTNFRLPIEVIALGHRHTMDRLAAVGLPTTLRVLDDGHPLVTDGGHLIVDATTGPMADPAALGARIKSVTGVVDHGLFVGIARRALLVDHAGAVTETRR